MKRKDLEYDEWITYCFDHPVTEPKWWNFRPKAIRETTDDWNWYQPTRTILASHLATLFENSAPLLDRYTLAQVNQGLTFICNTSEYFLKAVEDSVPLEQQIKWVRAIYPLFRDLFAKRCTRYFGHLDSGPEAPSELNGLCYMFWDSPISGAAAGTFPGREHLVDPIYDDLEKILRLDSIPCQESALHGLGHLQRYQSNRSTAIISKFLAEVETLNESILYYALEAERGAVQ